jgi:hypothetical protein
MKKLLSHISLKDRENMVTEKIRYSAILNDKLIFGARLTLIFITNDLLLSAPFNVNIYHKGLFRAPLTLIFITNDFFLSAPFNVNIYPKRHFNFSATLIPRRTATDSGINYLVRQLNERERATAGKWVPTLSSGPKKQNRSDMT